ncbi:hypothetical protein SAMN05444161_0110 [Rhizobiales bacterium GAS191]|nr:hypothetical protein SAMN05444161_0110 [Rhizobiales bacterium GAS191]
MRLLNKSSMGRDHRRRRLGTIVLALIAAYAQVLSLFAAYAASEVQPDLAGLICGHDASDSPSQDIPLHHGNECCTAACCVQLTTAAPGSAIAVSAPERLAFAADWASTQNASPRSQSASAFQARAPPVV